MPSGTIDLSPSAPTEVFLILHEHHERPAEMEYEYATGRLRGDLVNKKFGEPLSQKSIAKLNELGSQLRTEGLEGVLPGV